jgi:hypothetical protein
VKDFFFDFDRLKKGYVTEDKVNEQKNKFKKKKKVFYTNYF